MALSLMNALLCVIIVALGYINYKKSGNKLTIFIAISFALFGISHLVTLVGLREAWFNFLITIRIVAYLIVISALYMAISEK